MLQRLLIILAITACVILVPETVILGDDKTPPDMKKLYAAVQKLVAKHYPKAEVKLADGAIHFEYNTRKFIVHEALLTGEWQDAFEEVGPQKGGIIGKLAFQPGEYDGMAVVPQSFDKRYFVVRLLAPYSKKLDGHLLIHLKYPATVPPEFLKDFESLVNDFDEYATAAPK